MNVERTMPEEPVGPPRASLKRPSVRTEGAEYLERTNERFLR